MKLRCVGGSTAIFVTWKGLGMLKSLFQDDASPNLPVNTTLLTKSTVGFLEKIGVAILQYWAWPTTEAISVSRYVDLQGPLHQRKVLYPRSVWPTTRGPERDTHVRLVRVGWFRPPRLHFRFIDTPNLVKHGHSVENVSKCKERKLLC